MTAILDNVVETTIRAVPEICWYQGPSSVWTNETPEQILEFCNSHSVLPVAQVSGSTVEDKERLTRQIRLTALCLPPGSRVTLAVGTPENIVGTCEASSRTHATVACILAQHIPDNQLFIGIEPPV